MPICSRTLRKAQRLLHGASNFGGVVIRGRVGELRHEHGVDPGTVGGPNDLLGELWADMLEQRVLHFGKVGEVAVVSHRQAASIEEKRVQVLLAHDLGFAIGNPADMREGTRRPNLAREIAQVTFEDRQPGNLVQKRLLRLVRAGMPKSPCRTRLGSACAASEDRTTVGPASCRAGTASRRAEKGRPK